MEEDISAESSDLFKSVLGGLTKEQWEEYKLQKKLESGFIIDDDDDDDNEDEDDMELEYEESFILESHSSSPCNFDEEVVTKFDIVEKDDSEKVSDEEDELDFDNVKWNSDVAVKYVNGEIDFNMLTDNLEKSKSNEARKMELQESDEDDDEDDDDKSASKKPKRRRRRNYELPKELQGLMGAANISFASGDYSDAIEKCMTIINIAPTAQLPFQTLSVIYEEMGEAEKALQCALVAAYLNPSDSNEWVRLANMSIEQSQFQQAIKCFSCAIRTEPTNVDILWQRCNLYEQVGDRKNALASYKLILQNLNSPNDGQKCIELARGIAKIHYSYEDSINAVKVLESAFSKFPALVTSEDVNMLLEHLMNEKLYKTALKNLVLHCGVTLDVDGCTITAENNSDFESNEWKEITKCTVHECLHIDLMVKLLVCLIYVKELNIIDDLIAALKEENPEEVGDLYLDVAEALMEVGEYATAKPLLSILVNSHKYNAAGVWLKYADCLNMLSENSEATEAYERVLRLAPSYQEARIPLSKLLVISGDQPAAADALKQEYENGNIDSAVDLNVLVQRSEMLYDLGCFDEFINTAKLALLSHCCLVKTDEEIQSVINNQNYKRRREILRELSSTANQPTFVNQDVSAENLWDLFFKLCQKLFEFKQFEELQMVALMSMTSEMWKKLERRTKDAECLGLLACYYNQNYKFSYILVRDLIFRNLKNNRFFNLLCLNVIKMQTVRHNKFCLRLMAKNPEHIALGLFNGHNAMVAGSYKLALGEYVNVLKKMPDNPEINFYVGINFIHMASQKFATKRPFLITQGLAFLQKYVELRNESQESLYNVGRAFHQLGIKDAALQYYKKALETPPLTIEGENNEIFDLTREISYNIAVIYQSSNERLAFMYFRTYNVI